MILPAFLTSLRTASIATGLATAMAAGTMLADPAVAVADSSMTIAVMSQQDGQWAGAPLGTSPTETVGSAGCAISAVSMMLRYYGIDTDPGALNSWLTGNGGYAFDDQLIWAAVNTYSRGRVMFSGWLGPDLNLITSELDAGRPVVAEVRLYGNQHFVLLTGYTTERGYEALDPWFGDGQLLSSRYGAPATGIVSIRTFTPADPGGPRARGRMSWIANAVAALHLAR